MSAELKKFGCKYVKWHDALRAVGEIRAKSVIGGSGLGRQQFWLPGFDGNAKMTLSSDSHGPISGRVHTALVYGGLIGKRLRTPENAATRSP
jgi:hypothetical protein